MILPVVAICVLVYSISMSGASGVILWIIVLLNVFGSPINPFGRLLLQVKNAPYIESARVYTRVMGASYSNTSFRAFLPVILPQFGEPDTQLCLLEAPLGS